MKTLSLFAIISLICLLACNPSVKDNPDVLVFTQEYQVSHEYMPVKMSAGPSTITLRYWQVTNPGIRWTRTFDTLGEDLSQYRLAYNDNGKFLTGNALVTKMKEQIWEGHSFGWWIPVNNAKPKTITKYDTLTVYNPDGTWYWVIGWHEYPNPEYDPNWYADYLYKKQILEEKLREWFVIQERMWFPIIPGTSDYRWQYVYNYGTPSAYYVDTPPIPNKWNGTRYMLTDEDHYGTFSYWGATMAYKPYWLGTAQISIK